MENANLKSYVDKAINDPVKFLKEFWSIIIAIPYFVGGTKQILNLMLQSPDLIMFFSLTQVFIDGIVTLCKISFILVFIRFYVGFINEKKKSYPGEKILLYTAIMLFILIGLVVLLIMIFKPDFENFEYVNLFKFLIYGCLIITYINITLLIRDKVLYYTSIVVLTLLLIIIPTPFNFSNKIVNINEITNKINKNNRHYKLIYYNDQYLIFGQKSNDSIAYKVVKNDELFSSDNLETIK